VAELVRPVPIVVDQILAEHRGQVAFAENQDSVSAYDLVGVVQETQQRVIPEPRP
jgi:hypothetical protein